MTTYCRSTARTLFISLVFICAIGLLSVVACRSKDKLNARATEVFMRYFFQTIPESVTNVRLDQPGWFQGRTFTLHFSISREDVAKLIKSRSFVKVWNLKYKDGSLSWHWDRGDDNFGIPKYGSSLSLYGRPRKPRWFKPEKWKNPEVYAFSQKGDLENVEVFEADEMSHGRTTILVLIYSEKKGEAYLVAKDYSH